MHTSLLDIMACPDCGGGLQPHAAITDGAEIVSGGLQCDSCRTIFPVEQGIPKLLRSDVLTLGEEQYSKWKQTNEEAEKDLIDSDRIGYKEAHRRRAQQAGIPSEADSYFWENLLHEEQYRDSREVRNACGLAWTRTMEAVRRRNRLIFELVLKQEKDLHGKAFLNTGSGYDSDITSRFIEGGARVINNDIVMGAVQKLRNEDGQQGVCADLRHLPFKTGTLDGMACIEVLHHCHPLLDTLKEIRRVLKPSGSLFVVEGTTSHPGTLPGKIIPAALKQKLRRFLRKRFGAENRYLKVSPYEQIVPSAEIYRLMSKAGFRNIAKEVCQYAVAVFPARVVEAWERLGRRHPRLFTPFAFELFYFGKNP